MSRMMNRALNIACTALLLPALLIGCGAAPAPAQPTPAQPTPAQPAPTAPKPLTPTVRPIGAIALNVDTRDSTVSAQAITPGADSAVSFPTAGRVTEVIDVGANRYIMARFPITANQNFSNLTLVAYNKTGNEAGSAFKAFQSFGGVPSSANVYSLRPAHGVNASAVVNPNKADLQVLTTAEAQSVTAAAQGGGTPIISGSEFALEYGYVARRCTANCGTTPTWTRAISSGETGQVTVAVRVPQIGDPGSGYRFTMTFIVSNDTSTQYSQSLEEIASNTVAGIAQTNAAVTGATSVRVLCNSAYSSANKAFVLGARTAGSGATPLAQYGAQFYRNATAASFSVLPNILSSFAPGVAPLYTALSGATLSYSGGSSANGGNVSVAANGSFNFNPKAGSATADAMNFTVSDDQGCTAAPQTAPVTVSGPVIWFVNGAFVGTSDGRKTNPFTTIAAASSASSSAQTIFLYAGNYGGVTLKANQNLFGQLEGIAVLAGSVVSPTASGATVIEPAGATAPVLTAASGDTLTLASGTSAVRGVKLSGVAGGTALKGTGFGTLTIANTEIDTPGAAVNLDTGSVNATFKAISSGTSSTGPVNGLKLNAVSGANFIVSGVGSTSGSGGTIQRSTAEGILVTNSSNVNLNLMTVQNTLGEGIKVSTSGSNAVNVRVKNSSFSNIGSNAAQKAAVSLRLLGSGNSTFEVSSNTVSSNVDTRGIDVQVCGAGLCNAATLVKGRVSSNTITLPGGSVSTQSGIEVNIEGNGKLQLEASNNAVSGYGLFGLKLTALVGNANLQATAQSNIITAPGSNALDAFEAYSGSGTAFAANTVCLNLMGNTITATTNPAIYGVWLEQRKASTGNSVFALQNLAPSPNISASSVQGFVVANNTISLAAANQANANGLGDPTLVVAFTNATCETPGAF